MTSTKKVKNSIILKTIFMALVPVLVCVFYCLVRGESVFRLYIPNVVNNDSLFYYKLTEGIVSGGIPKGYFGYNESRAMYGTFASWNPAIVAYWVIWGKIFGWNFGSVIVSNIVAFSASLGAFTYLVKPKWRSIFAFFSLMILFPALSVHTLNALAETVIGAVVILYYAFAIREARIKQSKVNTAFMLGASFILTLIRPYMILFFFLPCFYMAKRSKAKAFIISLSLAGISFIGYFLMGKFLTSEYIYPVYNMTAIEKLFSGDIRGSLVAVKYAAMYTLPEIGQLIKNAFGFGMTVGTQYFVSLLTAVFLLIYVLLSKKEKTGPILLFQAIFVFVLFLAVVLIYQTGNDGGRHFYIFAVTGCLLLCMECEGVKKWIMSGILLAFLAIFAIRGSFYPTDYDAAFENPELEAQIEYWEKTFEEKGVAASKTIGYENTFDWVLTDNANGEYVVTHFNELYAVPKGMGISCCEYMYVLNNFSDLKSGYIAVCPGGDIEKMCKEAGFTEIGRTEKLAIYERLHTKGN